MPRSVGLAVSGIALAGLAWPIPAAASATTYPFTFHDTEQFVDAPPECMSDVMEGITNATIDGRGRATITDRTVTVHFDDTYTYRTDFSDGSYLTGVGYGHHTFTDSEKVSTVTEVGHEPRTIYSADGVPVGRVMIHALIHVTTNNETGDATASIDRFFFTCS